MSFNVFDPAAEPAQTVHWLSLLLGIATNATLPGNSNSSRMASQIMPRLGPVNAGDECCVAHLLCIRIRE